MIDPAKTLFVFYVYINLVELRVAIDGANAISSAISVLSSPTSTLPLVYATNVIYVPLSGLIHSSPY